MAFSMIHLFRLNAGCSLAVRTEQKGGFHSVAVLSHFWPAAGSISPPLEELGWSSLHGDRNLKQYMLDFLPTSRILREKLNLLFFILDMLRFFAVKKYGVVCRNLFKN